MMEAVRTFGTSINFCEIALMMEAASTSETSVNFYEKHLRNVCQFLRDRPDYGGSKHL
jgi:hypothetical protein